MPINLFTDWQTYMEIMYRIYSIILGCQRNNMDLFLITSLKWSLYERILPLIFPGSRVNNPKTLSTKPFTFWIFFITEALRKYIKISLNEPEPYKITNEFKKILSEVFFFIDFQNRTNMWSVFKNRYRIPSGIQSLNTHSYQCSNCVTWYIGATLWSFETRSWQTWIDLFTVVTQ